MTTDKLRLSFAIFVAAVLIGHCESSRAGDVKTSADFIYEWCQANTLLRGDECLEVAQRHVRGSGECVASQADLCVQAGLRSRTECFERALAVCLGTK